MKKNNLKVIFKIIISAGFGLFIFFETDWAEFIFYMRRIGPWSISWVLLYLAVLFLGLIISVHKWKMLAEAKGISSPAKDLFRYFLIGSFINNSVPLVVAGEAYKAYALSGEEKKYSQAASSVVMDRITGLIAAMLLAIIFSLFNLRTILESPTLLTVNGLILFSFSLDYVTVKLRRVRRFKQWVLRVLPAKLTLFLRELYFYNRHMKVVRGAIVYGILFSLVGVAVLNLILFQMLDISIDIFDYFSVVFLISIISSLPITLGSIGLKEWAYVTFFGLFGISPGAALAVAVLSRFFQVIAILLVFPFYLVNKRSS